jgi:hypothetical protein
MLQPFGQSPLRLMLRRTFLFSLEPYVVDDRKRKGYDWFPSRARTLYIVHDLASNLNPKAYCRHQDDEDGTQQTWAGLGFDNILCRYVWRVAAHIFIGKKFVQWYGVVLWVVMRLCSRQQSAQTKNGGREGE